MSKKKYNYGIYVHQSSSSLTKFIVDIIQIYVSKSVYYENIFHN